MSTSGSTANSSTRPTRRSAPSTTASSTAMACGSRFRLRWQVVSGRTGHLTTSSGPRHIQGIDIPLSRDDLHAAIEATLRANNRTEGYVRVIVSRGPARWAPIRARSIPRSSSRRGVSSVPARTLRRTACTRSRSPRRMASSVCWANRIWSRPSVTRSNVVVSKRSWPTPPATSLAQPRECSSW